MTDAVLPFDMRLKILQFLAPTDAFNLGAVNKAFFIATKHESLWLETMQISIANFTEKKILDVLSRNLAAVHYMTFMPLAGAPFVPAAHTAFLTYRADFPTHKFVVDKLSASEPSRNVLRSLLSPDVLPANDCRFIAFCLDDCKFQFAFWCPQDLNMNARRKEFWTIIYSTLVATQLDGKIIGKFETIQEFRAKLPTL
eukprot:c8365_g1_i1.p1 GENE.c8365_g1_i1~~c8365_g1_i1.p1  ORF type:complete len:210 (-),score=42.05 c8365_g1_i1:124-717(-)